MDEHIKRLWAMLSDGSQPFTLRLKGAREIGAMRDGAGQERLDLLLRLCVERNGDPDLYYVAGTGLAHVQRSALDSTVFSIMADDALWGFLDERARMVGGPRRVGRNRRQTLAESAASIAVVTDDSQGVIKRLKAITALADVAEDRELEVTRLLKRIADDPVTAKDLAAAAGRVLARVRLRQGIVDNSLQSNFTPSAAEAFDKESDDLYRAWNEPSTQSSNG